MTKFANRVTFGLLAVVLGVFWMLYVLPPSGSADMAAWAQALVTAAALVVALFLPLWQQERSREVAEISVARARGQQMESLYQLGFGVQAVTEKVIDFCASGRNESAYFRNAFGEVSAISAMLAKFEPLEFRNYDELKPAVAVMAAAEAISRTSGLLLGARTRMTSEVFYLGAWAL